MPCVFVCITCKSLLQYEMWKVECNSFKNLNGLARISLETFSSEIIKQLPIIKQVSIVMKYALLI